MFLKIGVKNEGNKNIMYIHGYIVLFKFFTQSQQDLWDKLRNGGLVVLMGHAKTLTDSESNTSLTERDISCKKERPLSAQGRNQAILIGEKFIKNKVPIEILFNSPYCHN